MSDPADFFDQCDISNHNLQEVSNHLHNVRDPDARQGFHNRVKEIKAMPSLAERKPLAQKLVDELREYLAQFEE